MRRALLCTALLTVAACPAPSDVTPIIHVDPHAAQRLAFFGKVAPVAEPAAPGPARVHVMKDGEQLGGPNAVGRPGDFVLENAEVAFVVDRIVGGAGFAESGGNVVDAADAHTRKDELGQISAYVGTLPRQGVYDTLATSAETDGSAWIEARGHELHEARLAVTTRYTLHAPDRALLIETTVENTGAAALELPSVGDAIQWGGAEKVAPGKARGFKGPSSGAYVGGIGRFTSYAITSTEGNVDALSGSSWTDTVQGKDVKLASHEKASYARVFVVGERADTSSLVAELTMAAGQPVGQVKLTVRGAVPGTTIQLTPEGSTEALTLAEPFEGSLPLGRYRVTPLDPGAQPATLDVKAEGAAELTIAAPPPAKLELGR